MTSNGKVWPKLGIMYVVQFSLGYHKFTTLRGQRDSDVPYKYRTLVISRQSIPHSLKSPFNLHIFMSGLEEYLYALDWNNSISGSSELVEHELLC